MKNFLRALKFAWQYRWRLVFSVVCALCAATLWGLTFTTVYPVLKVLGSNMNLHEWVDRRISDIEGGIEEREKELESLKKKQDDVEQWRGDPGVRERELRRLADDLTRVEGHLSDARSRQWRHYQLKHKVIRYMPEGRFNTMAMILGLVVFAVALKGVF
jgi:ATP-binding cassette, subfamily B, bacterial MsbA